jgi:hypothetical protein
LNYHHSFEKCDLRKSMRRLDTKQEKYVNKQPIHTLYFWVIIPKNIFEPFIEVDIYFHSCFTIFWSILAINILLANVKNVLVLLAAPIISSWNNLESNSDIFNVSLSLIRLTSKLVVTIWSFLVFSISPVYSKPPL